MEEEEDEEEDEEEEKGKSKKKAKGGGGEGEPASVTPVRGSVATSLGPRGALRPLAAPPPGGPESGAGMPRPPPAAHWRPVRPSSDKWI